MTDQYIQTQLFYTEEELTAKINEAVTALNTDNDLRVQRAKDNTNMAIAERTLSVMRNVAKEMDSDSALSIYNDIAEANNWTTLETLTSLYTVTVDFNGHTIAEFSDIEAEDEDSAIEEVRNNYSIDSVTTRVEVSYGDQSGSERVDIDPYLVEDDIDFTAIEQ